MKKSALTVLVVALVAMIGFNVMAGVISDWTPNGSLTESVQSRYINPTVSFVKYDKPQSVLDGWLNLPESFALEAIEYNGLNDLNLDGDKGDELDALLWKKIVLPGNSYLKLRLKWCDSYPVHTANGKDVLAYDAFLGRSFTNGGNTVTVELRGEYWQYIRDANNGMISVMPSVSHEYYDQALRVTVYERLGLQWNNEMAPFEQLLTGQASLGCRIKVTSHLTWNIVDFTGVLPLQHVDDTDPRSVGGKCCVTTGIKVPL